MDPEFVNTLSKLLEHESDEIRMASALCIGLVSISNLQHSVAFIIDSIRSSHQQYYYIVAINELIQNRSSTHQLDTLAPYLDVLCDLFFEIIENVSLESARPLMADCIGKLTIINPEYGFKKLVERTQSSSSRVRVLASAAFKYSLQHIGQEYYSILQQSISPILNLLKDENIEVQRVSLVTLALVLRTSPDLLTAYLDELQELVRHQTVFKVA